MVDLLERIGPYLGIAAFLGLAILAFLIFQQARDVRRLRQWAGRAPERAAEAAEAAAAAAAARGETAPEQEAEAEAEEEEEPAEPSEPGRLATWWSGARERLRERYAVLDRRMPLDPRYLFALLAAGVIAAAVLTSGFGLFASDDGQGGGSGGGKGGGGKPEKVEVAVLNGTQEEGPGGEVIVGVPGLADKVAKEVVKPAGFNPGEKVNATSGLEQTTIFFEPDAEADAEELADAVAEQLGETAVTPMIDEVSERAAGAAVALVVGRDDAQF